MSASFIDASIEDFPGEALFAVGQMEFNSDGTVFDVESPDTNYRWTAQGNEIRMFGNNLLDGGIETDELWVLTLTGDDRLDGVWTASMVIDGLPFTMRFAIEMRR